MNIFEKLKAGLRLSQAADRLKEASVKGNVRVALLSLGAAIVTGVVAQITMTCPDLLPKLPTILMAGVLAGVGVWMKSPKDEAK